LKTIVFPLDTIIKNNYKQLQRENHSIIQRTNT